MPSGACRGGGNIDDKEERGYAYGGAPEPCVTPTDTATERFGAPG